MEEKKHLAELCDILVDAQLKEFAFIGYVTVLRPGDRGWSSIRQDTDAILSRLESRKLQIASLTARLAA